MKISQAKQGTVVKLSSAGLAYVENCRHIEGFTYAHVVGFHSSNHFDIPYNTFIVVSVRSSRGEERLTMWEAGHLDLVIEE